MKIELVFLRSTVARRVFLLFIVSSLVPIGILAFMSYGQIVKLLADQQYEQLRLSNKSYGLALLDRLLLLNKQLVWIAENDVKLAVSSPSSEVKGIKTTSGFGFKRIGLISDTSQSSPFLADIEKLKKFDQDEQAHLEAGNSLLTSDPQANSSTRIFLARMVDHRHPEQGLLIGEVENSQVFGDPNTFSQAAQLCVMDESNRPLFCSDRDYVPSTEQLKLTNKSSSGSVTLDDKGDEGYLISYWSVFLKPHFFVPKWTIITRQSKSDIPLPVADFRKIFALVISLTLVIVAFLSVLQIRKSLIPLERIMEGIRRISNRDFSQPVNINSGDEFEELASTVNDMATTLDKQFRTMSTMADFDQHILSPLKVEDIVKMVLTRMSDIIPHDYISMTTIEDGPESICRTYVSNDPLGETIVASQVTVSSHERQELARQQYLLKDGDGENLPPYFLPIHNHGSRSLLALPVIVDNELSAIICLGYRKAHEIAESDLFLACDFSNRVAVALSKASWEQQLYYMAHYDSLTDLPNRLLLKDRLQQALARAERQHSFIAVLFIDLDRFKYVNDSLGHVSGDLLLREVAQRLSLALRNEDTVSRLGGDEFVVVIQQFTNINESLSVTTTIASKIVESLSTPFAINGREIYSTASVGIACYPSDGASTNELLKNADTAMYHAKSNGRNNYRFFSKLLNAKSLEILDLSNGLHRGLARGEFELYYQPKVDTCSKKICGAEALLRWNHPTRGRVPPGQFISLCEESGLIIPIGEWIIQDACRQAKIWLDAGPSALRIAVNLSPLQFRQPELIANVQKALQQTGLPTSKLEFEITESAAMEDIHKTLETLGIFSEMGIHLSIDDFGTGYSSLNYLKQFPINTLKIDRSFIVNLAGHTKDAAIVKSIITLAHSLDFSVVAEGVETQEQLDYLKDLECDEIQGYLFSPPLPVDEFTELLGVGSIHPAPLFMSSGNKGTSRKV